MSLSDKLAARKDELIAEDHAAEIEAAERQAAREQLELPHTPPNSTPGILERLYLIEKMLGIKESK